MGEARPERTTVSRRSTMCSCRHLVRFIVVVVLAGVCVAGFVFNGSANVAADRENTRLVASQVGDISEIDASALKGVRVREVVEQEPTTKQTNEVGTDGWSELATVAGVLVIFALPDVLRGTLRSNSARSDVG